MLQWFKTHPYFLRDESTALSNDSNYKELFQRRDNFFISHGEILVRLEKLYRHPILVVYFDGTPYQLPAVFPLDRNLTTEEMDSIASSDTFLSVYEKVKPLVKFFYDLRHQNSSGELCVLERENLEGDDNHFGITTILKRVKEWYAAHVTRKFPPDSEEVEFCSHFNYINREIKLLYTQQFLDENLVEGDCYAVLYKSVPKTQFLSENKNIYLSCFIDGVNKAGLIENINVNLESHFLDSRIKSSLDLVNKPDVVKELSLKNQIIRSQWFHIKKEPIPFKDINGLVTIIGNGDYDKGLERIAARCQETFRQIEDFFFIGIRFPNRKDILEFQLFKIYKSDSPPAYVLQFNNRNKVIEILKQYDRVEAIRGEKITKETFHQRNSKR